MDFSFVEYHSLSGGENFLEFTLWIASCLIIDKSESLLLSAFISVTTLKNAPQNKRNTEKSL